MHEYELSRHAQRGINCLDCHQPAAGQQKKEHDARTVELKAMADDLWRTHARK